MQPLHALKLPFFVSYLTIVKTGIGTRSLHRALKLHDAVLVLESTTRTLLYITRLQRAGVKTRTRNDTWAG